MDEQIHFRRLEHMFHAARINQAVYPGPEIRIKNQAAELQMPVTDRFHHAGGAMHGSVYFKMLDDAAYFAAASVEKEFFILTRSYETRFIRPFTTGLIKASGRVSEVDPRGMTATSELLDETGKVIGRGRGIFVKSTLKLQDLPAYRH